MAGEDTVPGLKPDWAIPYIGAFAITPADATTISRMTRAVYVGGAGTLAVLMADGSAANFTCVAGALLPIRVTQVQSTGTTATLIVGLI